jgi:hypothetical protein
MLIHFGWRGAILGQWRENPATDFITTEGKWDLSLIA